MNDYQFGNFVCSLREQKGLTQADVAVALDVTPAAVSKWENGASKPRVEVLFKLAELLEVRPEELLAGKRLEESTPDPEAVQQIYERYEALCRIDASMATPNRFRRLFAALLDWWIFGAVAIGGIEILMLVTAPLIGEGPSVHPLFAIPFLLLVFFYAFGFMFRDFLFGGRSLGKRIMRLVVLDKRTGNKTKVWQRLVRTLFLQIYPADIILLLVTGFTIGDRCAQTLVIPKKELVRLQKAREEQSPIQSINSYQAPSKKRAKWLIPVIIGSAVLFFAVMWVIAYNSASGAMDAYKQTPEYALAYEYLINSNTFANREYDIDKIKLSKCATGTKSDHDDPNIEKKTEFEFWLNMFSQLTVTCHQRDGEWYVCPECTEFQ